MSSLVWKFRLLEICLAKFATYTTIYSPDIGTSAWLRNRHLLGLHHGLNIFFCHNNADTYLNYSFIGREIVSRDVKYYAENSATGCGI